jgi:hypothetical protein
MRITLSWFSRRAGKLSLWAAMSFMLLSLVLTACGSGTPVTLTPTPSQTCDQREATATAQAGSGSPASGTPTSNTPMMRFWRPGVIAVGLQEGGDFRNVLQDTVSQAVCSRIQSILGQNGPSVSLLRDGTGIPALITSNSFATLFLSVDDTKLVNIVNAINDKISDQEKITIGSGTTATITAAGPDFYTMVAPNDWIGGSPGGPPQRTSQALSCSSDSSNSAGSNQTVYVLDTIDTQLKMPPKPGSVPADCLGLQTDTKSYPFPPGMSEIGQGDQRLSQAFQEHGIFGSALIHHLAPQAHIHLIQVLNNYGVGDIESLIWGLSQVDPSTPGAIVNMSLTVVPPLACVENVWGDLPNWQLLKPEMLSSQIASRCDTKMIGLLKQKHFQRLYTPLGNMINSLVINGDHLVAAAGNDSADANGNPSIRLPADAPAAYCGVIAVSAAITPIGNTRAGWQYGNPGVLAPFSNVPYPWAGHCLNVYSPSFGPLGQGTDQLHGVVALGMTICSLFLQQPSGSTEPIPGDVDWSGTSFATTTVSGNLAADNLVVEKASPALAPGHSFREDQPCVNA